MLSPNVTNPEIYIKLNRAMTLHDDLKGLLGSFVASDTVHKHIAECILELVAAHDATMIRANRGSLDPELHAITTWDRLGRSLERAHNIWLNNSPPPPIAAPPGNTTPTRKRKYVQRATPPAPQPRTNWSPIGDTRTDRRSRQAGARPIHPKRSQLLRPQQ